MRKWPSLYIGFVITVLIIWFYYISSHDLWSIFSQLKIREVMLTMVIGAFVAGSSPEGSASIAYPIFTLWLDISPSVTKNFAFAIQSIGMTAASLFLTSRRFSVDRSYIFIVSISGAIGLVFGTFFVADFIPAVTAKLFFVSLWVSLAYILYKIYYSKAHYTVPKLGFLNQKDHLIIITFGFIGGVISSVFGTGINILTFCLMVVYYQLDIKVATRSSIIIMTIETILGSFLHLFLLRDFDSESKEMWLACIPVVVFAAPLGALMSNYIQVNKLSIFIGAIFAIQFIGAMIVIKPTGTLLLLPISTIIISFIIFNRLLVLRAPNYNKKPS